MTIMSNDKRELVNGALLPGFVDKRITIVGLVSDVAAGGTSFNLRSTDNLIVPVNLRSPLDMPLEGYVEVHGVSKGKTVQADSFIVFNNQQFDAKNHNVLCKLLQSIPDLW